MRMGMTTMAMGSAQGGAGESQTDITIPSLANVVRAWSLRRNIPVYANGNSIKELRSSGGAETDVQFLPSGVCKITGADAYANVLYDQKGADASKLVQATFTACPKVFESGAMLKGLYFDGGDIVTMGTADAVIESALVSLELSYSFWFKTSQNDSTYRFFFHRGSAGGVIMASLHSGKIKSFLLNNVNYLESVATVTDNAWHLCTITHKNITNGHKIYLDGSLSAQTGVKTITAASSNLTIGGTSAGASTINGSINDIILWNVMLDETAVTALYNAQKAYYGL